jgi:hypothetical protein
MCYFMIFSSITKTDVRNNNLCNLTSWFIVASAFRVAAMLSYIITIIIINNNYICGIWGSHGG